MLYNKLFNNLPYLVLTEKHHTSIFLWKPRTAGSVKTKNTSVRYFSVQNSRAIIKKLINCILAIHFAV